MMDKEKVFSHYLTTLVDRIYKILPLYEEKNDGLFSYVQSLIYEINGLYWVVPDVRSGSDYIILISTLESISDDVMFSTEDNHAVIKREIFKCLEVVKRMKTTNESGE